MTQATATRLDFDDEVIRILDLPQRPLRVTRGLGSGLVRVPGATTFWAIGDRGPNLKIKLAVKRYGVDAVERHRQTGGAKLLPCLDIGPALVELALHGDRVEALRVVPLTDAAGRALTGLPLPGSVHATLEPAIALDGTVLAPSFSGADTEGVAVTRDGHFWIGEEYGPSLLHVAPDGRVLARLLPAGEPAEVDPESWVVHPVLPAIAAKRQINRGFEAIALLPGDRQLVLAFQSPLAHPNEETHAQASHIRLWVFDLTTQQVVAEHLYPLDAPETFARDVAAGKVGRDDIKVSEIVAIDHRHLLVLERASATTKIYRVTLSPETALSETYRAIDTRPTVEEMSAAGTLGGLPVLAKSLVVSTDDLPQVDADLEALLVLDARTLLLVNDNDFGIEDVATRFWRVELSEPLY